MLDLGAAESSRQAGSPTDPTEELVGVLAARTANEGAPAKAVAEIGRRRENGRTPIGLYRLSEVLARPSDSGGEVSASVEALTDDPELIVEVVRRYPCALLDIATPAGLARTLEAVLMDGKRVLVSGTDAETLRLVRRALPDTAADLCLDEALPLSDSEQRELRSLLITATPARRARLEQALPESEQLPSTEEVARLCREAGGECGPAADAAETPETVGPAMLVPELVGSLEPPRLSTLRTAATRCVTALDAVDAEDDEDTPWSREALSGVVFGSGRTALTNLLRRTADVVQTADKLRDAGDQMAVTGEISDEEQELLRDYANFLDSGGRSRSYFRSARQRAVEPVLGKLRLEAPVQDASVIRQALTFIELVKAMREVGDLGGKLGVPPPTDVPTVDALHKQLVRIKDAGLKAEELRREVQFAHPASPVRVMALADMASIETVARTIVECSDTERLTDARNQLSALADGMVRATPGPTGPEVDALVRALRQHSLPKYGRRCPVGRRTARAGRSAADGGAAGPAARARSRAGPAVGPGGRGTAQPGHRPVHGDGRAARRPARGGHRRPGRPAGRRRTGHGAPPGGRRRPPRPRGGRRFRLHRTTQPRHPAGDRAGRAAPGRCPGHRRGGRPVKAGRTDGTRHAGGTRAARDPHPGDHPLLGQLVPSPARR